MSRDGIRVARELVVIARELTAMDSGHMAEELTRLSKELVAVTERDVDRIIQKDKTFRPMLKDDGTLDGRYINPKNMASTAKYLMRKYRYDMVDALDFIEILAKKAGKLDPMMRKFRDTMMGASEKRVVRDLTAKAPQMGKGTPIWRDIRKGQTFKWKRKTYKKVNNTKAVEVVEKPREIIVRDNVWPS